MTLHSEDFSGGTDAATIATGNTNFDFVSGSPVFDDAVVYAPSGLGLAGVFVFSTYGRFDQSFTTQYTVSVYFQMSAGQDGTREIIQFRDSGGSTTIGGIAINSSNRVVALNNTTTITGTDIAGHAVSTGTWYRVDTVWTISATVGRVQYRICNVNAGDTNTPITTAFDSTASLNLGSTAVGRIYFGFPVDPGADGNLIVQHVRAEDGVSAFHDGLWVATPITETLTDNVAMIEADDGTPPFTIAQDSGTSTTPTELDDGAVSGTGRWIVAKHSADTLVYTVTDAAAVDSDPYNIPPISPANTQLLRPTPGDAPGTTWI